MPRPSHVGLHLLAVFGIAVMAACACIYANPYSLHRVVVASFEQFDAPPDEQGRVVIAGALIDFRLPRPTLRAATLQQAGWQLTGLRSSASRMQECVALVRRHLNATDASKPPPTSTSAEALLQSGDQWICRCGEHALLLNEVLQASGFRSRVLWMEGHVAAECFDEDFRKWVFLDAHLNTQFQDVGGIPLSAAELIRCVERDETVTFVPICREDNARHSQLHATIDRRWYRNILLNGECYTLPGSTLQYPGRWSHLARFLSPPQMLVLATPHDSSHAKYIEPFGPRRAAIVSAALVAAFYGFASLLFGWRQPRPFALSRSGRRDAQRAPSRAAHPSSPSLSDAWTQLSGSHVYHNPTSADH